MEIIGRDNNGNFLLKVTQDEQRCFQALADALGGNGTRIFEHSIFPDMSNAFSAILTYATHKRMINDLKRLTEEVAIVMDGKWKDEKQSVFIGDNYTDTLNTGTAFSDCTDISDAENVTLT